MEYQFALDYRKRVCSFRYPVPELEKGAFIDANLEEVGDTEDQGLWVVTKLNANSPPYIDIPYDPYPVYQWQLNRGNEFNQFDFKQMIGDDQYEQLYSLFKYLPRREFEIVVCEMLSGSVKNPKYRNKSGKDILGMIGFHQFIFAEFGSFLIASSLLDIYNRANVDMVLQSKKSPAQWEQYKTLSFVKKDYKSEIEHLSKLIEMNPFMAPLYKDELKKVEFEGRVKALPKASDPVLNVQRDTSMAALIKMKEWDKLEMLCSIYEKSPNELKSAIKSI